MHLFSTRKNLFYPFATLAPHCVPWHRPPGQVWSSAGERPCTNVLTLVLISKTVLYNQKMRAILCRRVSGYQTNKARKSEKND